VSGFSVTFQNNRLGWSDIVPDSRQTAHSLDRKLQVAGCEFLDFEQFLCRVIKEGIVREFARL
jgi:hypothetical protein